MEKRFRGAGICSKTRAVLNTFLEKLGFAFFRSCDRGPAPRDFYAEGARCGATTKAPSSKNSPPSHRIAWQTLRRDFISRTAPFALAISFDLRDWVAKMAGNRPCQGDLHRRPGCGGSQSDTSTRKPRGTVPKSAMLLRKEDGQSFVTVPHSSASLY